MTIWDKTHLGKLPLPQLIGKCLDPSLLLFTSSFLLLILSFSSSSSPCNTREYIPGISPRIYDLVRLNVVFFSAWLCVFDQRLWEIIGRKRLFKLKLFSGKSIWYRFCVFGVERAREMYDSLIVIIVINVKHYMFLAKVYTFTFSVS